ncbi:hypothetical protein EXE44_04820 [Halorubrum sp. SS7]|uniref:hypothetical protein n=1 Tax=unclassified Halorubrum TaxID=2642239 RepID=UPI0010F88929|nr:MULTISPECIES: hypothetical protein [unclassified Halorubrum]TKX52816.1 hypothetical protein EXE42_15315 [Halorubrum sp. SP3]TKX58869.1 hypothetical protein EXE44_04820 [Halorubrum sp. SS7]TKX64495.1 hypothetical protein EXE45_16495 [Halorubrum sp. SP9]
MNVEDVLGGMELPPDTDMVQFGFVTDTSHLNDEQRRLRVEALDETYTILEAREVTIPEGDNDE